MIAKDVFFILQKIRLFFQAVVRYKAFRRSLEAINYAVKYLQLKFTKFLILQSLQMVKIN